MSEPTTPRADEPQPRPPMAIRGGEPTEDELAAVTAVLMAAMTPVEPIRNTDRPLAGGWKSYYRVVRREHRPGPGAWRVSGR
ncbi:acyl-CoA carboxylase subunit epsilon [Aestuariimicrobium ganziense]|uniref:acyl-CoA carboxylase subunit epsilon n=1 Tax=Aestuariimicrobium ganziense TaxID=2773677 RepID=UPI001F3E8423|nr:acyl-CoA carboxylase subunit epsilon [Aestuariimicrobium ganziense]